MATNAKKKPAKAPAKKAAAKKAVVKKAVVKTAPVKSAPAKKAPVKSAPAKSAPAKKAPVKKAAPAAPKAAPVVAVAAAPVVSVPPSPARKLAPPVLTLEHLTMRFGGLVAVDDLSFEARHGEITALIGPNGAGKTTVFNCITGFYKPTTGLISLHNTNGKTHYLDRMPDFRVCADAKVARTFQNIRLFSGMTILENLLVAQHNHLMVASGMTIFGMFGLPGYRRAEKASIQKAAYWLDKVGLTDRADDPAGDLPYGAQRRLEIARAMCTDPVLLCLDEPAAGLNPRESAELNTLLTGIREETGTSILLIEHDMSVVMGISDHVVVLEYGRKIADGTPAEVKNDPKVIAAYLGVDDEEVEAEEAKLGIQKS